MELGDQVNVQRIHKVRKRKKREDGELKKDRYGVSTHRPQHLGKPETLKKGQTTVSANLILITSTANNTYISYMDGIINRLQYSGFYRLLLLSHCNSRILF
jgi:hypothetical protein